MKLKTGGLLRAANAALVTVLVAMSAFRAWGQLRPPPQAEKQPEDAPPPQPPVSERAEGVVQVKKKNLDDIPRPAYMIYYGALDEELIQQAKQYDIVILHPGTGVITREQIEDIQSAGTLVFAYLSIGEDLRTAGMTPEQMLEDERFLGDGSGPRVDPREAGSTALEPDGYFGEASPGGTGYASYYLDDNDRDGKPDFNPTFGCAYTNIGDPLWYDVLRDMTLDGGDGVAGIRELLTDSYGRGLDCDGLLLDTMDTCTPLSIQNEELYAVTRFEWTAPGVVRFLSQLREEYPDKYLIQNRGLFFYNYQLPHFDYDLGQYIDILMFESYGQMVDPSAMTPYEEEALSENRDTYAPKLCAEAGRPDGFRLLSLDYAEGLEQYHLKETLTGESKDGLDILLKDLEAAEEAGFSHYITDISLTLANDFVLEHRREDARPPVWSSVHNLELAPVPRVGIGEAEPTKGGMTVRWDVAIDASGVYYTLYYQKEPFDFEADPNLDGARRLALTPGLGDGYGYDAAPDTWPYQQEIGGLEAGETYYFVIRARDGSPAGNEEKNTVVLTGVPE